MRDRLKRYGVAVVLLIFVTLMMLIGTLGVEVFGNKISKEINSTLKPVGERIKL